MPPALPHTKSRGQSHRRAAVRDAWATPDETEGDGSETLDTGPECSARAGPVQTPAQVVVQSGRTMSKAFTKESDDEDDDLEESAEEPEPAQPAVKNYITPTGLQRLRDELKFLLARERPAVTQVVAWAASNGDRSENADYQYGKRRLRQ